MAGDLYGLIYIFKVLETFLEEDGMSSSSYDTDVRARFLPEGLNLVSESNILCVFFWQF